jgi:hypothetical protein
MAHAGVARGSGERQADARIARFALAETDERRRGGDDGVEIPRPRAKEMAQGAKAGLSAADCDFFATLPAPGMGYALHV